MTVTAASAGSYNLHARDTHSASATGPRRAFDAPVHQHTTHELPPAMNKANGFLETSQPFTQSLPTSQHMALCQQAEAYLNANGKLLAPPRMCPPDVCFGELGTQLLTELFEVAKANTAAYANVRHMGFVGSSAPPSAEPVTLFQSSLLPPMVPSEFVGMIVRNTRCDPNLVTLGVVLVLRYCEKQKLPPTLHMLHRMLAASIQVATKAHKDRFLRNDLAATLCGLLPQELNRLEAEVLHGCEWQVLILTDELADGSRLLTRIAAASVSEMRPAARVEPCVELIEFVEETVHFRGSGAEGSSPTHSGAESPTLFIQG